VTDVKDGIRRILEDHARLAVDAGTIGDDVNLYDAGMSSHASVNVMVALEDAFGIEFPDSMLRRSTFATVEAISSAVAQLRNGAS
jgi:acyl carrier protein